MKTPLLPSLLAALLLSVVPVACAFDWPGGTMTVTATCTGSEVFAGWVPSSPWGSTAFTNDPQLQLRDGSGAVVAQQVMTGAAPDWFDGGTRTATVTFTVPPGSYSLVGLDGTRHVRIPGDGWSGFRLTFTSIVEPTPPNVAPVISWGSAPASVASGQPYSVAAQATDPDGNLAQVNVWKNGVPFAFAGGGTGYDGSAGSGSIDGGPQSITYTAQAVDGAGATSTLITHVVGIAAPPPVQHTLATSAAAGGSVTPGGTYDTGTVVTVAATPDAWHDFAGWSGDAGGSANPLALTMDGPKAVQAVFTVKLFALTTSAVGGGSVTPGGSYPYGSVITLTATPDALTRFTGWTGDVTSASPSVAVSMTAARTVQAVFEPKFAQTISFANPGNHGVGSPPFALDAMASSGLPVSYAVVSGPASLAGGQLTITGPGTIVVQATQPGDGTYLPAPPVSQSFNASAAVVVRFRPAARTVLQSERTGAPANLLLETP